MRLDSFFPVSYPMTRYEFSDEKSSKFWEIEAKGKSYSVQYGKIGTTGQTQTKTFADVKEAKLQAEKAATSKLKRGYMLVSGKGPAAAPGPKKKKTVTKKTAPGPVSGGNSDPETAIFENPEDLASWAVYGDWLHSQGDPQGEAVAIGVAQARHPDNERYSVRLRELFANHCETCMSPLLREVLDRGLKDSEDVKIPALLESLDIYGENIDFTNLRHERLQRLRFIGTILPPQTARAIAGARLPALESLTVYFGEDIYELPVAQFEDIQPFFSNPGLSSLKEIDFGECAFQAEFLKGLAAHSKNFPELRILDMYYLYDDL